MIYACMQWPVLKNAITRSSGYLIVYSKQEYMMTSHDCSTWVIYRKSNRCITASSWILAQILILIYLRRQLINGSVNSFVNPNLPDYRRHPLLSKLLYFQHLQHCNFCSMACLERKIKVTFIIGRKVVNDFGFKYRLVVWLSAVSWISLVFKYTFWFRHSFFYTFAILLLTHFILENKIIVKIHWLFVLQL